MQLCLSDELPQLAAERAHFRRVQPGLQRIAIAARCATLVAVVFRISFTHVRLTHIALARDLNDAARLAFSNGLKHFGSKRERNRRHHNVVQRRDRLTAGQGIAPLVEEFHVRRGNFRKANDGGRAQLQ